MKYMIILILFAASKSFAAPACNPDWRTWMKCKSDADCTVVEDDCGIPRWTTNKTQISKMDFYRDCIKKKGDKCPADLDPMVLKKQPAKCRKQICMRFADMANEAIMKDDEALLTATLQEAGDLNLPLSHIYETPLTLAAMNARPKLVEMLIKKGANINHQTSTRYTPLIFASMSGSGEKADRIETVKILLKNSADKSVRNIYGESAADAAKAAKNTEVLKLIEAAP